MTTTTKEAKAIAPISLPAGSYDFQALIANSAKLADVPDDATTADYNAVLNDVIASSGEVNSAAADATSGFKMMEIAHPTIEGVIERQWVYVGEEAATAPTPIPADPPAEPPVASKPAKPSPAATDETK